MLLLIQLFILVFTSFALGVRAILSRTSPLLRARSSTSGNFISISLFKEFAPKTFSFLAI
ncbi:hypothetical protein [Rickettsia conorii]|uniref:hypothetical protein n=1 Tax=Rickettsia conorii TaxID=781 RepID=UPI0022608BFB|nr:hypothetical protein [Rickettsia conorii]UZW38928.1 hypothetical protein OSR38_01345 [Rickettsia conorii subsp. heilongjiangensis]